MCVTDDKPRSRKYGLSVCLFAEGRNGAKNRQLALEGCQKFHDSLYLWEGREDQIVAEEPEAEE